MLFALCFLGKSDFRESKGWGHNSEQAMPLSCDSTVCLDKAGGRVEPLGRTPKKNHPVQLSLRCHWHPRTSVHPRLCPILIWMSRRYTILRFSDNWLSNPSEFMDLSWSADRLALQLAGEEFSARPRYCIAIFVPLMSLLLDTMQTVLP